MAKFREGDLVLSPSQKIIQGPNTFLDNDLAAYLKSLKLSTGETITSISNNSTTNSPDKLLTAEAIHVLNIAGTSGTSGSSGTSGTSAANKIGAGSDEHITRYDGSEDVQTSPVTLDDSGNINGINDLSVNGNISVDGTTFVVHNQQVTTTDNIITVNYGEPGSGVTAGTAGMEVDRGLLTNYQFLFAEATDTFRIGELGSLQAVATREDIPLSGGIPYWDDASKSFITTTNLYYSTYTLYAGRISLQDNRPIYFSNSWSARIYHTGAKFIIENGVGDTEISSGISSDIVFNSSWIIENDGDLIPFHATSYDIGSSTNEVKNIYQGDNCSHFFGSDTDAYIRHSGSVFQIVSRNGVMYIGTEVSNGTDLVFQTRSGLRWKIEGTTGHFVPYSRNYFNIGSTTNEVQHIYQGDNGIHYFGDDQDATISHSGTFFNIFNDTGSMSIKNVAATPISFMTDNSPRWLIDGTGHFVPHAANTYNIGSTTRELQHIYQGVNGIHYFGDLQDGHIYYNGSAFVLTSTTGGMHIGSTSNTSVYFKSNDTFRWTLQNTGHFVPFAAYTYNIGAPTYEVNHIYQGDTGEHLFGDGQRAVITHTGSAFNLANTIGIMTIGNINAADLYLMTSFNIRWKILSGGNFVPGSPNSYNIGSIANEVKHIYQGDSGHHYFGDDQDTQVYHNGSNFHIFNTKGQMFIQNTTLAGIYFYTNNLSRWYISPLGNLNPTANGQYDIGTTVNRVRTIYAVNALNTSDYRLKENIKTSDLGLDFISKLNPVKFTFKEFKNERMRYGLIAQEVNSVLDSLDMEYNDFNGIDYDKEEDIWSIGYIEFIAPMIKAIQELKQEIENLKK